MGRRQLVPIVVSIVAGGVAFEQSEAVASRPIALLNAIAAFDSHKVGSVPWAACFDRQVRMLEVYLPIAVIFFESQRLLWGAASFCPARPAIVVSQTSMSAAVAPAVPMHEPRASALVNAVGRTPSGLASQVVESPAVRPLETVFELHVSADLRFLPVAVSFAPVHLLTAAGAGTLVPTTSAPTTIAEPTI
jgi:hypothetical protein